MIGMTWVPLQYLFTKSINWGTLGMVMGGYVVIGIIWASIQYLFQKLVNTEERKKNMQSLAGAIILIMIAIAMGRTMVQTLIDGFVPLLADASIIWKIFMLLSIGLVPGWVIWELVKEYRMKHVSRGIGENIFGRIFVRVIIGSLLEILVFYLFIQPCVEGTIIERMVIFSVVGLLIWVGIRGAVKVKSVNIL